jgi:magnesium transporter
MEIYFSDLTDYIDKVWHTLEECKETIEIYKDTDVVIGTDRTNRILAILTILFTFSIPLTLLGTLYGMNVNLPGGIERPWTFLGPYSTFFAIIIAASVPVTIMYFLFRKMRWL